MESLIDRDCVAFRVLNSNSITCCACHRYDCHSFIHPPFIHLSMHSILRSFVITFFFYLFIYWAIFSVVLEGLFPCLESSISEEVDVSLLKKKNPHPMTTKCFVTGKY